jgi:hypothetical protein
MYRTLAAFVISPAAPLLLAGVATLFVGPDRAQLGPAVVLTVAYAYPAALVAGVPLYFYARRKQWLRWWQVVLQAALIGAGVPIFVLGAIAGFGWQSGSEFALSDAELNEWAHMVFVGLGLGGATGTLFFLIAGTRMGSNSAPHTDARHEAGARG